MPVWIVFVVLCAGTGIAIQMPITALAAEKLGLLWSVLLVNVSGLIVITLILIARGTPLAPAWRTLPWTVLLAGPLGMGVMAALAFAIPRIGITATLVLSIAAQLLVGVMLDRIGFFGMELRALDVSRIAGIAIVAVGTWLVVR
ncbi:DMT family transporter [Candidatus Bipolaricaulota bacterium]